MSNQNQTHSAESSESPADTSDEARREVLRRLGLFAAYTAPTVLGMMYSNKAAAIAVDSTSTC